MGRAVVRSATTPMGSGTGINVTVVATGATGSTSQGTTNPPGQTVVGIIQDLQTNAEYQFTQAFGAELGIAVGVKVEYNTVTVGGVVYANSLRLVHRGEILTINATDDGGTLLNKANGQTIPFAQTYASESGLAQGVKVNFVLIVDPNTGQTTAVSLQTAAN